MQTCFKQLQGILKEAIQHLEEVLDTLHQERAAMVSAEHQTLLDLIEKKTNLIDKLADLDREMTKILADYTEKASMYDFLALQSVKSDPSNYEKLQALWEYYVALLRACRDKNSINSNVVNLRLQRLKYEYQYLTQGGESQTAAYDAKGKIQTVTADDPETVV